MKIPQPALKPSNPVFRFELARGRGLMRPRYLKVLSQLVIPIAAALAILWWVALLIQQFSVSQRLWSTPGNGYSLYVYLSPLYQDMVIATAGVVALGSILVSLIADFWYLLVTVSNINRQVNDGHWGLLRLTSMREGTILEGLSAAAEVRGWPAVLVEMVVRGTLVVFLVVTALLPGDWLILVFHGERLPYPPLNWSVAGDYPLYPAILEIAVIIVAVMFGAAYIFEPLWRLKAMLTVGLAVSARFRLEPAAVIAGSAALLTIRVVQAALLAGLTYSGLVIVLVLSDGGDEFSPYVPTSASQLMSSLINSMTILAACVGIIVVNRAYYKWVRNRAFNYLREWAFRHE